MGCSHRYIGMPMRSACWRNARILVTCAPSPRIVDDAKWNGRLYFAGAAMRLALDKIVRIMAGMLPPVRLRLELPATAVAVPLQPLTRPLGLATVIPEGKLSVSAAEVMAVVVVLVKVSVNCATPLGTMVPGEKLLLRRGACVTVSVALAATMLEPALELSTPAGNVLI